MYPGGNMCTFPVISINDRNILYIINLVYFAFMNSGGEMENFAKLTFI